MHTWVAGLLLFGMLREIEDLHEGKPWGSERAAVFWQFVALMWILFFLVRSSFESS